ncbi:MAG: thioredoxin family protein [Planctomycetes bacterium]|nr:thioredoxin family protein [Planctomycetota bacterium]
MKLCVLLCIVGLTLTGCASNSAEPTSSTATDTLAADAPQDGVVVYYMHRTLRCPTCMKIEQISHETVQEAFAAELASGRIKWQTLDYQERDDLAQRYGVTMPSVVLVSYRNGAEMSHQVLDKTWSLYGQPAEFQTYVVGTVRECLDSAK